MPQRWQFFSSRVAIAILSSGLFSFGMGHPATLAQTNNACQIVPSAAAQKEALRQAGIVEGNPEDRERYRDMVAKHGAEVQQCRRQTWPQNQALWLRVYPCDSKPGVLEGVLDEITNKGYNQVYVEAFYDGQVLLPASDNPTPWNSVVRSSGAEDIDLLSDAISIGRERGLKVYAWLFTLNFGYTYGQRFDRASVLARNGYGDTTLTVTDRAYAEYDGSNPGDRNQAFVDPYDEQARQDYRKLVDALIERQPDGVLFDYVRYPRGTGARSVVSEVQDLWIYGEAAKQALYQRALNSKGRELIERFLNQGYVSTSDVETVNRRYPQEEAMWQGRNVSQPVQEQLWYLSVAHAVQGVLDFLADAIEPVERDGIATGAVFFPDANQSVGEGGFDSRLQAWDRFPASMQWHPMIYGVCGQTSCIVDLLERVLNYAPLETQIVPAIAGKWGESVTNRPPLEVQMRDIQRAAPQVNSISHFAYSWQNPESDRERKFCSLN
ncbi:hypothetical protein IQ235_01930 [Oscillatoriales cyanobacterium LEGE 11467]|uniref:Glycosyl hydrolase-like 10 domain-containing protein n=2 Tax=Zarconia TaxID=2992130 RepID=A0A928VXM5_9CYAN|nr:hypothetical protein [Zarconia navalis LEGE 11467]